LLVGVWLRKPTFNSSDQAVLQIAVYDENGLRN